MKRTEWLALEAVQPGMKVAEAVLDSSGQLLVPAGAEVSESVLAGLARRAVSAIKVEYEVEEDPVAREARRKAVSSQLDQLFRRAGEAVETRTLYEAVLAHRLENPK